MKRISRILGRPLLILLISAAFVLEADAQSSVRRTPRKENSAASGKSKNTGSRSGAASSSAKTPAAGGASGNAKKSPAQKPVSATAKGGNSDSAPVKRNPAAVKKNGPVSGASASVADEATLRSQAFDAYQKQEEKNTPWQRTVYRELDLTRGSNASLYYPVEPTDGLTNLFRVVLELVASGKVQGYEYLDGREVFTEQYAVKVQDVLDKYQILYKMKPASGRAAAEFTIEESDVPSNEVLSYFVKERWEFDHTTSHYGPRIVAICPVLHRAGDFGGEPFRYPLFWLRYEDLRPYLRKQLIISDGMNGAPRYTMEDFFNLQQYEGDIYKVQNLRGLSLMQQYPNPDTLRLVRKRIDAELNGFGDSIWVKEMPSSGSAESNRKSSRSQASTSRRDASASVAAGQEVKLNRRTKEEVDVTAVKAEKEAKIEAKEQEAEQTGVAHSVRRSRR